MTYSMDWGGIYLVLDEALCTVYIAMPSWHRSWLCCQDEDRKFYTTTIKKSSHPVSSKYGGDHVLVPFAMEDGGTLGAHALGGSIS